LVNGLKKIQLVLYVRKILKATNKDKDKGRDKMDKEVNRTSACLKICSFSQELTLVDD
jgi:hypothetical protein